MQGSDAAEWLRLKDYMQIVASDSFYRELMEILTVHRSRRTVQVATRKYRARRKRR